MDTTPQLEHSIDSSLPPYESPYTVKNIIIFVTSLVVAISLPITMWISTQNTYKPSKANALPMGSIHINPETITTDIKNSNINLSALAYDTGGNPIWSGVSYQWGISSTETVGLLFPNGNDKLAAFEPSRTTRGRADIWVRGVDTSGNIVTGSIPVYVGVTPTPTAIPTPTLLSTPTPNPPTPTLSPADTITVLYPNGGEILEHNNPYTISWSMNGVTSTEIQLTTDTGYVIHNITTVNAPTTSYVWYAHSGYPDTQKLKIKLIGNRQPFMQPVTDSSNGTFTIYTPPTPTPIPPTPTNTPVPTVTPTLVPTPSVSPTPKPNSAPKIVTTKLPTGYLNNKYNATITATDSDNDVISMTITGLPRGITRGPCAFTTTNASGISEINCYIQGTPRAAGTYTISVVATDNRGGVTKQVFKLPISRIRWPWSK